jgi:hypothetical protein
MRLLIKLLPYHLPKLSAVAVGHFTEQDFAARLDRFDGPLLVRPSN